MTRLHRLLLLSAGLFSLSACSKLSDVCAAVSTDCAAIHILSSAREIDQIRVRGNIAPNGDAASPKAPLATAISLPASIPVTLPRGLRNANQAFNFSVEVVGFFKNVTVARAVASGSIPAGVTVGRGAVEVRLEAVNNGLSVDMRVPVCRELADCITACLINTTNSPDCVPDCRSTFADGNQMFNAAFNCSIDFCLEKQLCVEDDMGSLQNPAGAAEATCDNCLTDAVAELFGQQCQTPGATCNIMQCKSLVQACRQP